MKMTDKMKQIVHHTKVTLIIALFTGWSLAGMAQGPPPPPGGGHGQETNQPANGGGAPIGGGIALLLGMGAAWGGRKAYRASRCKEQQ